MRLAPMVASLPANLRLEPTQRHPRHTAARGSSAHR